MATERIYGYLKRSDHQLLDTKASLFLSLRGQATGAGIYALEHKADIAKVQAWLVHANISTTRIYERRQNRPEDSPTDKV